jgi:hypothetical protein
VAKARVPAARERTQVATAALTRIASGEPFHETSRWLQPFSGCEFPFPGDVFVELAADALAVARVTRANPVSLADAYERHLPERPISGNAAHQKSRAALLAAVALHAGIVPDYGEIAGWWRIADFDAWAFQACVTLVRVAAERTSQPVNSVCAEIAAGGDLRV